MITVAISQRVAVDPAYKERRDSLDQRWSAFLEQCGIVALPIPNSPETGERILDLDSVNGVILTGGGNPMEIGGDTPERDETERRVIKKAKARGVPLLGVCRGMQMVQLSYGVGLKPVKGHVGVKHPVRVNDAMDEVNSFHDYAATTTVPDLEPWAMAEDGSIEAVWHKHERVAGIMWHPEREDPFRSSDINFFRQWFSGEAGGKCAWLTCEE